MNTEVFWNVIGEYNEHTIVMQIILMIFLCASISISYKGKIRWMAKLALGITNIFIGIAFFAMYGTQPIQKFFALPLYLLCGVVFLYECVKNKDDEINIPNKVQTVLILLYLMYPLVSIVLGNSFPKMVTYIMPCPVVSLSIAVYSCYNKKNKFLLILLTLWGLTGIKSVIFKVYEDFILLICGIYGVILSVKEFRKSNINRRDCRDVY